jgi:hypothetical protein
LTPKYRKGERGQRREEEEEEEERKEKKRKTCEFGLLRTSWDCPSYIKFEQLAKL